jgi:pimeloyl-ACP methyl ester carboxylesterase
VVVIASLVLGSCTSASRESAAIEWADCSGVVEEQMIGLPAEGSPRLEFGCGTVTVPLDPADEGQGTIALQLIRAHQSGGSAGKVPLLLIAGGPGQSGVDGFGYTVGRLPPELVDAFDLVGFDPRGVARSQPIRCPHAEAGRPTFPDLLSDAGFARAAGEMRRAADECAKALGATASLFSTTATAADIDRLRAALGQSTLTYIGWSYGAKLGAEYARLFPDRVRAAVLDAPSNPDATWIEIAEHQVAAFEQSFDQFVAWCAAKSRCAPLGDVREFVGALVRSAEESPIASGRPGGDPPAYGWDVVDAVAAAMYDDVRWPDLAEGLAEAAHGDAGTLRELSDAVHGHDDAAAKDTNADDANLVINCNDSAPGPTEPEIRAAGKRFANQYPLFGRWGSWQLLGCAFWQPQRHTLRQPVAPTARPVVVVGTLHDPATPYAGAVAMASALGNAELVTWEGAGHGAVGRSDCVTHLVATYVVSLKVPPPRTRCPR